MFDICLTVARCIDPSTIVPITECQEDDTEDDRGRNSIAANYRNRVTDGHDLDREGSESFEKRDDVENEIHI